MSDQNKSDSRPENICFNRQTADSTLHQSDAEELKKRVVLLERNRVY